MKFKKYLSENLQEASISTQQMWEDEMNDIEIQLENPDLSEKKIAALEKRLEVLKQKFAKQRAKEAKKNESIEDMHKRCPECNTLLNDGGTCPKCDDGEEDYEDNKDVELNKSTNCCTVEEFGKWFVLKDSDGNYVEDGNGLPKIFKSEEDANDNTSSSIKEDLSVREKLKRAYPELNFETNTVEEAVTTEKLSNKEKLLRAYPELNFDNNDSVHESYDEYDDDYYDLDDVEQDRVHASLYGGDRMYCDCGRKLVMTEWGGYCPECEPEMDPKFN